jgi:hypothetical protein
MHTLNYIAIIAAALSAFILGGIWYSPKVFGKTWQLASGMNNDSKKPHTAGIFVVAFVFALLSALAFAVFASSATSLAEYIHLSLIVGVLFVATSFAINYLFAGRHVKLLLIDAGYHIVQFLLYGLIIGLWH